MPAAVRSRRLIWWSLTGVVTLAVIVAVLARRAAVATAARSMLRSAGAQDVQLSVSAATPWRAQIDDMEFELNKSRFAARRVIAERARWWQPRLSSLRVEGAEIALSLDDWPRGDGAAAAPEDLPLDAISLDGHVSVGFGDGDTETVAVAFEARRTGGRRWAGTIDAHAPGAQARAEVDVDLAGPSVMWHDLRAEFDLARFQPWARRRGIAFTDTPTLAGTLLLAGSGAYHDDAWSSRSRVEWREGTANGNAARFVAEIDQSADGIAAEFSEAAFSLAPWVPLLRRLEVLPAAVSELGGSVVFVGRVKFVAGTLAGDGDVRWREGRLVMTSPEFIASDIEAEFRIDDLAAGETQPGTVRMGEVQVGPISATEIAAELAVRRRSEIVVSRATANALGGSVSVEPFTHVLAGTDFEATLVMDRIAIEEVLALAEDVPARAVGRVNGRVPVRYADGAFLFGTGWLALTPGTYAEVQLEAQGLLTGGVATTSPSYATLHKIESGLLRLQLSELRLDIRSPDAPPGRTATIRLAGAPVDREVKAPVNLSVNVNGPVEQLLNLGLDSRIRFGGPR